MVLYLMNRIRLQRFLPLNYSEAMINVTTRAQEKIRFFLSGKSETEWGVRVSLKPNGTFGFSLEEFTKSKTSDQVVDANGTKVIVDKKTAPLIDGGTIDFVDLGGTAGFKVELKEGASPFDRAEKGPDLSNPQVKKIHELLQNEINPALAAHGGKAQIIDVKENVAYMQLGGGCQGCGQVDVTLRQGIEARIKQLMPEIVKIVDKTDHAAGENPYFKQ